MDVTKEAYRTADESGSPDAAGTVAWNWISELAQAERDADAMLTEIVSQPVEGGGRVTRLYRGSTLLAVATTFRDTMNCTVLTRWVSPDLTTAQSEAAELRAEVERLREYIVECDERAADEIADKIVLAVSELPDRTSPIEAPDEMIVTADELREIVRAALTQGPTP